MLTNNTLKVLREMFSSASSSFPDITVTDYSGASYVWYHTSYYYPGDSKFGFQPFKLSGTSQGPASLYLVSNNTDLFSGNNVYLNQQYAPYSGVIFGDGDTEPDADDYCLAGNIITGFTATSALSSNILNGKIEGLATYTITNTSGSAFTIKEIGVTTAASSLPGPRILMARSLLETPLTIASGDTGIIQYKFNIF